jgi:hypothetical protein
MRNKLVSANPNMTEEEWGDVRRNIENDAQLYGAWEAIPEAVSNALTLGIVNVPIGKIAQNIPFIKKGIARAILAATGKAGAGVSEEVLTEAVTAMEQSKILADNGFLDNPLSFSEAIKEVAPETSIMTLAMLGAGSGIRRMVQKPDEKKFQPPKLNDSLAKELETVKEEDVDFKQFETESIAFNKQRAGISLTPEEQLVIEEVKERTSKTRRAQELESERAVFEREFGREEVAVTPTELPPSEVETFGPPSTAVESFRAFEEEGLTEPLPVAKSAEESARVFLEQAEAKLTAEEIQETVASLSETENEYQDIYSDRARAFQTEQNATDFITNNKLEGIYDTAKDSDTNLWVVKPTELHLETIKQRGESLEDNFEPLSKYISILSGEEGQVGVEIAKQPRVGLRPIIQREIEGIKKRFPTLTKVLLNERGSVPVTPFQPERFKDQSLDIQDQKIGNKTILTLLTPRTGPLSGYTIAVEPPPTDQKIASALGNKAQEIIEKSKPTGSTLLSLKRLVNKMKKINQRLGEKGAVGTDVQAGVFKQVDESTSRASQKRNVQLQEKLSKVSPDRKKNILKAAVQLEGGKAYRSQQKSEINSVKKELINHTDTLDKSPSPKAIPKLYRKLKSWSLVAVNLFDEVDDFKGYKGLFVKTFYNPIQKSVSDTVRSIADRRNKVKDLMKASDISAYDLIERTEITNGHYRTKQQMMYIWLGQNNPYTKSIMQKNMGITDNEISIIDKLLTSKEKEFAKFLQKDLESSYDKIADVLTKNYRYIIDDGSLSKSDIRILKDVYETGKKDKRDKYRVFSKAENYLPMWVTGSDVTIDAENIVSDMSGLTLAPVEQEAHIAKKFTYERRTDHDYAIDIDFFNLWERVVNMQEHFINLAEPMRRMEEAYKGDVAKEIGKKFGGSYNKAILSYFNRIKNPNFYRSNRGLDKFHRGIRRNIAVAYLGYNVVTGLKQVPSLLYYLPYTSLPHLMKAIASTATNVKGVIEFAHQDPQMKERIMDRYLAELDANVFESVWDSQLASKFGKRGTQLRNAVVHRSMLFIRAMDTLATSVGYKAVYDYEMSKGGITDEEARNRALLATVNTQPAAHPKDIPQLYAHNEWLNHFLMFSNQLNKIWNLGIHTVFDQTVAKGKIERDQALTMASLALGATMIWSISNGLRAPEDPLEISEALFEGAMNSFPIFGRWMAQAYAGYPAEVPIATVPVNIISAAKKSLEAGKITESEWNKFAEATLLVLGLPYTSPRRAYKAIQNDDLRFMYKNEITTKAERDLESLKKDIVKWKEKNTPEGKERDVKPLAYQIIDMEKMGEDQLVKHLTNRFYAMARKNGISVNRARQILYNLRKQSGKELSKLLDNTDWSLYLKSLEPSEKSKAEGLRKYVNKINNEYYEVH